MNDATMAFRNALLHNLHARLRLIACAGVAVACYFLTPANWLLAPRLLSGWNIGVWLYVGLVLHAMGKATEASIRRRAEELDEGRFVALALSIVAACAAMAALIGQLSAAREAAGVARSLHLALAGLTIFSAWTFIHVVFAQHYAHEFYIERDSEADLAEKDRGGLRIPGDARPVFLDFLYFSFVIGVACQTADIAITSRPIRKLSLIHCILSFFFNTTILALMINIAAGLLSND